MRCPTFLFIAATLGCLTHATDCFANNNLFLPGDAFFPTVLTKADIEKLQDTKTGERTLTYSSLGGYDGAFCGFAGYQHATIPAIDDPFAQRLAQVYDHIRVHEGRRLLEKTTNGKVELVETNGIRVLFYPVDFDFTRHQLGLRYNENWVAEALKFGHRREHLRLCNLIDSPDAVAISWRDADAVPALPAKLPAVKSQPVPATPAPVIVEGDVKAVVIGSLNLKQLFQPADDDRLTIYIVDSQGVTQWIYDDGAWNSQPMNER